ncbi:hypothetical protein AMECASPLE_010603 [Ameca splendens]|uniref:Myb proto-oncogene protein, plant n=1 Tax=Ameca splendens TaxID=208324 RepID=A0ABV0ZK96_9TELE
MKKITGFKQKDDQTDGGLDRANELNTFFNRFSSETSFASSSPAHSQTDIPPSFDPQDPQLSSNTSHVFGLWEEAGVPGENPRMHGENMQTPCKNTPSRELNRSPSCCQLRHQAAPCFFHLIFFFIIYFPLLI